jgi:hypothetical protein
VYIEPLVMSVAVQGPGAQLLELGEQRADFRSLKAELRFPIAEWLPPLATVRARALRRRCDGLRLLSCRRRARSVHPIRACLRSQALRPFSGEQVPLAGLLEERAACQVAREPERCALLDALFGWGDTVEWAFPEAMPTFGD